MPQKYIKMLNSDFKLNKLIDPEEKEHHVIDPNT